MLYNGEQIGDGSPPQVDIAVDPLEGTTLAAHGMPSALAVIALSARGTMFDPGPCVYMEKMAGAPEIADLLDLDRPLGETVELIAERKGSPGRRRDGRGARPPAPRAGHRGDPRGRRARAPDRPRRRLGGAAGRHRALARRSAVGHRRHARGGDLRGGRQVPRRAAARAGCGRATSTSARPRSRPATTSSACSTATTWSPARTCSSRPPASPTATCCRACATRAPAAPRPNRSSRARARAPIRRISATHDRAKLRAVGGEIASVISVPVRIVAQPAVSAASMLAAKRPTRDSARSRRASERRKP